MSAVRRIDIRVTPRAKRPGIETGADGLLHVKVAQAPSDGQANAAVIEALAKHFGVAKRSVRIVQGETARRKRVEILA